MHSKMNICHVLRIKQGLLALRALFSNIFATLYFALIHLTGIFQASMGSEK